MIRDRGTIKWTAMMLPEHVQMIKKVYADQNKVPKPQLDEQAWEEIQLAIHDAKENNLKLTITYWKSGYYETLVGKINRIDVIQKQIQVDDQFQERYYLQFGDLVYVNQI